MDDHSGIRIPRKKHKHDTDTLSSSHKKNFKTIEEGINNFIQIFLLDLYMFVHVVTRRGSGKAPT